MKMKTGKEVFEEVLDVLSRGDGDELQKFFLENPGYASVFIHLAGMEMQKYLLQMEMISLTMSRLVSLRNAHE